MRLGSKMNERKQVNMNNITHSQNISNTIEAQELFHVDQEQVKKFISKNEYGIVFRKYSPLLHTTLVIETIVFTSLLRIDCVTLFCLTGQERVYPTTLINGKYHAKIEYIPEIIIPYFPTFLKIPGEYTVVGLYVRKIPKNFERVLCEKPFYYGGRYHSDGGWIPNYAHPKL